MGYCWIKLDRFYLIDLNIFFWEIFVGIFFLISVIEMAAGCMCLDGKNMQNTLFCF